MVYKYTHIYIYIFIYIRIYKTGYKQKLTQTTVSHLLEDGHFAIFNQGILIVNKIIPNGHGETTISCIICSLTMALFQESLSRDRESESETLLDCFSHCRSGHVVISKQHKFTMLSRKISCTRSIFSMARLEVDTALDCFIIRAFHNPSRTSVIVAKSISFLGGLV